MHGLRGYEGYIACLEERRNRELRILRSLSMDSHIIAPLSDAERISALVDSIGWRAPSYSHWMNAVLSVLL